MAYANGQTITYTVEYQLPNTTAWKTLSTWERPISYTRKRDETLDYGQFIIENDEIVELPPFTLLRMTNSQDGEPEYWYSTDWSADVSRAT